MKPVQYKLKKWYPSLPYTFKEDLAGNREVILYLDRDKYYRKGNYNKCINFDKSEVENNPEFWEEFVEKDYEILSFKLAGQIYEKSENDCFFIKRNAKGYKKWKLLDHCNATIYSIKRLNDGEIFTVGDRLNNACDSSSFKIKFIYLYDNDIFLRGDNEHQWQILYRAIKVNAEKWIENNKPKFSKKDICDAVHKVGHIGINNRTESSCILLTKENLFKELNIK